MTARIPIPMTCKDRPVVGGVIHPWVNVHLRDGGVDFRARHTARLRACWERRLCQVCGLPLAHPVVLIGTAANLEHLVFDEAPLHAECAVYTSKACPMVSGAMTHYADRLRVSAGPRGAQCFADGCDCDGWVPREGEMTKDGQPAEAWYAVYVNDFMIAHDADGDLRGGCVRREDVFVVRHISTPGQGRQWRTDPDALAGYTPPRTIDPAVLPRGVTTR